MLTMSMEHLFEELESQLGTSLESQFTSRLEDEERHRRAQLTLRDRFVQLKRTHSKVTAHFVSEHCLTFSITNVGKDWISAQIVQPYGSIGSAIIPIWSLLRVELPADSVQASLGTSLGTVSDVALNEVVGGTRLKEHVGCGFILRDLGRRRKQLSIQTSRQRFSGTIDHVGKDHLDLNASSGTILLPVREILFVLIT